MKYVNLSIKEYTKKLSSKEAVPGGGSAASLVACLGVSCLLMAANFSLGKKKCLRFQKDIVRIIKTLESLKEKLLILIDLDTQAYKKIVQARSKGQGKKLKALAGAKRVSLDICKTSFEALDSAKELALKGNLNLIADIEAGVEFLLAAFKAAFVNVKVNSRG